MLALTQKIKAKLTQKARAVAASAAAAEMAKTEAARNGPMLTPAAMAASRRDKSPLAFSGDVRPDAEATRAAPSTPSRPPDSTPRPETSSANRGANGGGVDAGATGRGARVAGARQEGSDSDTLRERERQLDAREHVLREREDAMTNQQRASGGAAIEASGRADSRRPKSERERLEAEVAKVHQGEARRDRRPGPHAAAVETRPPSFAGCFNSTNSKCRPESTCSRLSLRSRAEDEGSLIAKCRALGVARRRAAADRRRHPSATTRPPSRPAAQQQQRPETVIVGRSQNQATRLPEKSGRPPTVPVPSKSTAVTAATAPSAAKEQRRRIEATNLEEAETCSVDGPVVVEGRTPSRPQSANAARRGRTYPRPRPRSAASSRSNGAGSDEQRGGRLRGLGAGINGVSAVRGPSMDTSSPVQSQ